MPEIEQPNLKVTGRDIAERLRARADELRHLIETEYVMPNIRTGVHLAWYAALDVFERCAAFAEDQIMRHDDAMLRDLSLLAERGMAEAVRSEAVCDTSRRDKSPVASVATESSRAYIEVLIVVGAARLGWSPPAA